MDQILNIDNSETKQVGITPSAGGATGSIDFLSDNNSDKPTPINSPNNSPMAKPASPQLGVSEPIGIELLSGGGTEKPTQETNLFGSGQAPSDPKPDTTPHVPGASESFMVNQVDEFKPLHRMSPTEIKN